MHPERSEDAGRRDLVEARKEVGRALEVAFARWGEWHRVERVAGPRQDEARIRIARAEDDLIAAQHRLAEAETRARE